MPVTINGSGTITGLSVGGLPDGIVDTDMLADNAVTSAKSTVSSPITVVNTWRINAGTSMTGTNDVIDSNWEEADTYAFGKIGTSLSQSSGVFTFPSTGQYLILSSFAIEIGSADDYGANVLIQVTTDGTNYNTSNIARTGGSLDGEHSTASGHYILDVTNTSTHKIRWYTDSFASNTRLRGHSNEIYSYFTAIRIGDT